MTIKPQLKALYVVAVLALASTLGLSSCARFRKDKEPTGPIIRAGQVVEFRPVNSVAQLRFMEGRYPTLFSGRSTATWYSGAAPVATMESVNPSGDSEDTQSEGAGMQVMEAEPAIAGVLTITCQLTSQFGDMSIAYDIVSLRGARVYLETPEGTQILPAEIVVGKELTENQVGALKSFSRTNTVIFPTGNLRVSIPPSDTAPKGMRLVIQAHNTQFYFEWLPILPTINAEPTLRERKRVKQVEEGTKVLYEKTKDLSHTLD